MAAYHQNLGFALEQLGRDDEAISAFRHTIAVAPDQAETLERLGALLLAQGRRAAAIDCFRRAAAAEPDTIRGRLNQARVLAEEAEPADIEAFLRQSIALYPASAEAKSFLSNVLREQGRFDEALPLLVQATEGSPAQAAAAYYDLAHTKRITTDDQPMLDQMQALLRYGPLPDIARQRLHFGLGKAYDDLGRYEAAMRHFDAGNRLAHSQRPFDWAQFGAGVNRLIATFTPAFFAAHAELGCPDDPPLLVLGMPRSGTTLVEQILSSHPAIGGGGESGFWYDRAEAFGKASQAGLTPAFIDPLTRDYLSLLGAIAPGAARVTDKTPGNFLWIGLFHLAFPRARIIHCRRHPVDTCLSNYFTHFNKKKWMEFAYDRADLVFYYRYYAKLMAHWRAALPPEVFLDVDYEELVTDREAVSRRMIAFAGLAWDDACLRPEANSRTMRTASSVARWRHYEPWLGELRQLLEPNGAWPQPRRTPKVVTLMRRAAELRVSGRLEEAISALVETARLAPNDPWLANELGLIHLQRQALALAVECFERTIALDPGFAVAHYNLACALERQRRPDLAVAAYQQAIALAPGLAEAHSRLGNLLHAQGRRDAALDCFRQAAEVAPDSTLGRLNRVKLCIEEEKPDAAEALLRCVIADDPSSSEAWRLLGNNLREAGHFDEAGRCLEQAIARDPTQIAAWHDLVHTRRLTAADRPLIGRARARLQATDLADYERALLNFALGKGLDDLGEYAEAIRHFDAGNRLEHGGLSFNHASFAAGVDRLIEIFTPDFFASHTVWGTASELPVCVLGMPRSGTTLVEQIVSSHPAVGAGGELRFWNERASDTIKRLDETMVGGRAAEYLVVLRQIAPAARRVTDKNPFNFLWAGLIHLALPAGRIVHCRRNPVDTCLSIYFTRFATRQDFAYDRDDLVFYYRHYERLMAHWRAVLPSDRFLDVDYEALVRDRNRVTRRLIAFLGLDWDDACLHPEGNRRVVRTASMWQSRQPVYGDSVERWRHYEPWLGALRELLDEPREA